MWVMTVDQRGSRRVGDRVEPFLELLTARTEQRPTGAPGLVRPFERTVGDEVQAVLDDPSEVVDLALHILRLGGWSVGIGAGAVATPLPASTRAGSGAAFVLARDAVEAAKSRARIVPLAVRGDDPDAAAEAEAVLVLLAATAARRSRAGWDAIDATGDGGQARPQAEVAAHLGISQQAVSQRLRTALWHEERAARPAVARLLGLAARTPAPAGRRVGAAPEAVDRPRRAGTR